MNREELKGKIDDLIWNHSKKFQVDEIMMLIDEYTKPKTKKKSLEERKGDFREHIYNVLHRNQIDYSTEMLIEFQEYWTEHNEGGQKMRFEMSKNQPFNIKRRLVTWKSRQKNQESKSDTANNWLNK